MNRFFCLLLFLPFLAQAHYFTVLEAHYASLNGIMLANNQILPDSGIIEIVDGGRLVLSHAQGGSEYICA